MRSFVASLAALALTTLGISLGGNLLYASLSWPHEWVGELATNASQRSVPTEWRVLASVLCAMGVWLLGHAVVLLLDRWVTVLALLVVGALGWETHPLVGALMALVFWEYSRTQRRLDSRKGVGVE